MKDPYTILIVDDTPYVITLLIELLSNEYEIKVANSGINAIRVASTQPPPDLILLDIMMPEVDGYEVCRQLKTEPQTRNIPIIFLTAMGEIEDEQKGLSLGAVDYIHKPISPPILKERIKTHLLLKEANETLKSQNEELEQRVQKRTQQLVELQDATIFSMAAMAETRDPETGNHIRRTQYYVKALAEQLCKDPLYSDDLTNEKVELIFKSVPLHDIGKVGIPEHILIKEGKLTEEEFKIMKQHTTYGSDIIASAEQRVSQDNDFLLHAREIAIAHHERWDGTGYPNHLKGDQIPTSARLMAIADAYDALISDRMYKPGLSHESAMSIIKEGSGAHFDPVVTDAFLMIGDKIKAIAAEYPDVKSQSFYAL